MHSVTTKDKTRLYVKDWGEGKPVILIHGWPLSADSWDEQTGAQDATLMGFSMGGGEVARYMSRHGGQSVARAVLVSSVLPFRLKTSDNPAGTEQAAFDKTALALKTDRAKFFPGFFKTFFGAGLNGSAASDELLEWARGIAMQASLKATIACMRSFSSTDFRGDLKAFEVPTLIIHGTEDKTVPIDASSRAAAQGIAHSTLIEYDGAPHGLFATDKGRLTKDLLGFLARWCKAPGTATGSGRTG